MKVLPCAALFAPAPKPLCVRPRWLVRIEAIPRSAELGAKAVDRAKLEASHACP